LAIDKSGRWWRGDGPEDIEAYLRAFSKQSYAIAHYRPCKCSCSASEFMLERDSAEQARRKCPACGIVHYIADAEEFWEEGPPESWTCVECKTNLCNAGVGFAGYADDPTGIRWIYVGVRCAKCGVLGCFADWKVALGDALDLLDKA
jgi:hypothetical protein